MAVACLTLPVACHFMPDQHRFLAPCGLGVTKVLYVEEQLFGSGFLPGDNETGVIAFQLPEDVSARLREGGVNYLKTLSCPPTTNSIKAKGQYYGWRETPIVNDQRWRVDGVELALYLDKYGFSIPIDKVVEAEINKAIQNPGSFYAYSNAGGVILLVPSSGKAYFFYAG